MVGPAFTHPRARLPWPQAVPHSPPAAQLQPTCALQHCFLHSTISRQPVLRSSRVQDTREQWNEVTWRQNWILFLPASQGSVLTSWPHLSQAFSWRLSSLVTACSSLDGTCILFHFWKSSSFSISAELLEITAETRGPKPLVCYAQDEKSTGIHSMKVECILNTSKLHFSFLFKAILSSELRTTLYSIILFDKTYKIYVLETNCWERWAQHQACGLLSSWD